MAMNLLGVKDRFWTGGTSLGTEPDFYWMGHDEPVTFTDWHNNEPNNGNWNEYCIEIKHQDDIYKWNDSVCSEKIHFVCEERISKTG